MFSTILHTLTAFVAAHPGGAAWLAATMLAIYRTRTPAQWVALGESKARLQGLFKMARGAGFDPARVLDGAVQTATGRRIPDPRELVIASQAAELAQLRESLAAYQRRVGESHAVTEPFDLSRRQTIVPEVAAQIASETLPRDGQRGSISLRALLVVALLSLVALAASCIPARRFVLDRTDGVPARVACTPRTQACFVTDAGVYLPVVYSDECRPWPTLSLRADGTQRACAPGEGCAVDGDSGIASCTSAADASVGGGGL